MILIVDDKPENIFSLKSILEINAFKTDSALSGEEALRKVLKNEYALILLDVQMPDMDGFEVAEAITSFNKTRDVPIIFLSAVSTHKRFIAKGFESGAVDYITKPVDPDILIMKVRNFYRLYEKTHALKEAEKKLTASVNELHSTLESIPQIAFTANAKGVIEFVNQHWFQYSPTKDTFPETPASDELLMQQWLQSITSGTSIELEIKIKKLGDGIFYYHLLRAVPVSYNGSITKWVGTLTNIHEQKMLNEVLELKVEERTRELLTMNKELELTNHELQQFASVASHDLKEPLRKIHFFGSMIKEKGMLNEQTDNYLNKIMLSSQRMSTLINDLLSFARLSAAEAFETTDVNVLIHEILNDLELLISEKKAVFHISAIPKLEVIPSLMRHLFFNIIGNALKFSKPDVPPEIFMSSELNDDNCSISIRDNGIGFDERYVEKIFILFQRLNQREQYEGTGIGLAIAKKIVDKHNGTITARSKPGEGATFLISLPVHQKNDNIHHSSTINSLTA